MNRLTSSVILCTRNRIDDVVTFLHSLAAQTQSPNELIVVDSGTMPINQLSAFNAIFNQENFKLVQLKYFHTAPGLTYQRNVGIAHAIGDIVYFFDDDTILQPTYLELMQQAFVQYSDYAGGMGNVTNIPGKTRSWYWAMRVLFLLPRDYSSGNFTFSGIPTHAYGSTEFKTVQVLGGCCMAFRKSVFTKELFDQKLVRYGFMEDCDMSRRVSRSAPLFYNPVAKLQHLNSPTSREALEDNRAMFIKNYSYLFFKNFYPHNKLKIIGYGWSVLGLFIEAAILREGKYFKGYYKGLKEYYFN